MLRYALLGRWVSFSSQKFTRCADLPQTSSLAFLVEFSRVVQLENTEVSLSGCFLNGHDQCLHKQNEELPGAFLEESSKSNMIDILSYT